MKQFVICEGRMNEKYQEPAYLLTMYGDSSVNLVRLLQNGVDVSILPITPKEHGRISRVNPQYFGKQVVILA